MAWTDSRMFREWPNMVHQVSGTGYTGLDSDSVKVALFNNSATPDRNAAVASTGFNTGTWVTANEVTDVTNWPSGGLALANKTFSTATAAVFQFDADDRAGSGTVTLSNAFGCLVYDDAVTAGTVADQGVTFHYFGGGQSVTAGTFTVVWHTDGIFRITV